LIPLIEFILYSIIERDLGNDTIKWVESEYGDEDSRQAGDETDWRK
jgi:hypothetical protein